MLAVASARVPIINSLYAAATRNVVFARRQFQIAVVWQRQVRQLHQSLAVSARTHYHRTVQVLQAAARYLACACRVPVHQYHHRHNRIERLHRSLIVIVCPFQLAPRTYDGDVFRHKHIHDVHRLVYHTATVVAQVEHQFRHSLALHVEECPSHLLSRTVARERTE